MVDFNKMLVENRSRRAAGLPSKGKEIWDSWIETQEDTTMAKQNTPNAGSNGENPLLAKQLKAMKDRWNKSKTESKTGGSGTTLSPAGDGNSGRHICRLTNAKMVTTDKGISMLLEFTAVAGDEIGEKAVIWLNFTEDRLVWAQRDLRKLDVDVDALEPEMLPQVCKDLLEAKPMVRISIKQKDEYINVYIDKLLEDDGSVAEEVPAEEPVAVEEPAAEELNLGDDVSYTVKGKPQTGVVKKLRDDDTIDIRNDATKAIDNVDRIKVKLLANVED